MFSSRISTYLSQVQSYENSSTREACRAAMPLERLLAEAHDAADVAAEFDEVVAEELPLLESLTRWFKTEFFTWVSSPPCWNCGQTQTYHVATVAGHNYGHGVSRVERYRCPQCQADIDFPRYNNPVKLLETRKGRCGEWANCFTCLCRALNLEARLVIDWTDHVWTEIYIPKERRWIHVDCCECIIDKPLLYEAGWGKQLTYIIAFDRYGVKDVSRRYSRDWKATMQRRCDIKEEELVQLLSSMTSQMRTDISGELVKDLERRDQEEANALNNPQKTKDEQLPGRTTGSSEWRQRRGELGGGAVEKTLRISTAACRRVVLTGGQSAVVRASGEHQPNETASALFDGQTATKWLDFGGGGEGGSAWIEIRVSKKECDMRLSGYALTSGNDCQERDPAEWELQGIVADGTDWMQLDYQKGVVFKHRQERALFQLATPVTVRRLRLCIWATLIPAEANSVQMARFEILPVQSDKETS